MKDEFYVLADLDNYEFLMENGETTPYVMLAERFLDKKDVIADLENLDNDKDFVCYKVTAEYWLKREFLK